MKIKRLMSENVMRIKVVEIVPDPDGNLVIIGGKNEQGKSSVIDSIQMVLGGVDNKRIPEPVRTGSRRAEIVAEFDTGLTVRRTITPTGGGGFKVTDASGKLDSPQAILDSLYGSLSFDPLAFSRMDAPKQSETLRELLGLDFSEIDLESKAVKDERAEANREVKRLKGSLDSLVHHEDVGAKVDVSKLLAETENLRDLDRANHSASSALGKLERAHERAMLEVKHFQLAVDNQRKLLQQAKAKVEDAEKLNGQAKRILAEAEMKVGKKKAAMKDLVWHVEEIDKLAEQVAGAEDTNDKARDNERYAETTAELTEAEARHRKLDGELRRLKEKREDMLAAAEFPLPGLGFDENGVTIDGHPFKQASAAQALKTSLAMGMAMNKKLKVILIRNGSDLDDDNLKVVAEMAAAEGYQVWLERVGKGDECSVIMEDGLDGKRKRSEADRDADTPEDMDAPDTLGQDR